MKLIIAFLIIFFLSACNSKSGQQADYSASDSVSGDSVNYNIDTISTSPDTTKIAPPSSDQNKKYGILGYSYFKSMRQNETRNINAYVTIVNSEQKVIDTLREINSEIDPVRKSDTASVFTQNIILYKSVDITLIDPGNDFIIKPIHENSRQEIDSLTGKFWSWAITPKTKKSEVRLILRVVAEKPDGSHESFQARNIPITIVLDPGILRSIYIWLYENPEKLLVLILIPLVGFFWKQIIALFSKKPKNG